MTRVLVLLPPSEGKARGGDGPVYDPASGVFAALATPRRKVAKALRSRQFDAASQLGVQGESFRAAVAANRRLGPTMPALQRYTGVLYGALGYDQQPAALRAALDEQLVIVSGLLGLVGGADPVPDYKLPIGAAVPGPGRLAGFWKPHLARALARYTAGAVVWNLLPLAHAAAAPLPAGVTAWQVRVRREHEGSVASVSHDNKAVKGALARALVTQAVRDPGELAGWEGPGGYRVRSVRAAHAGGVVDLVTRA